jgi:PKHD-type hydroxylase
MIVYPVTKDYVEPYALYDDVFSVDECNRIVEYANSLGLQESVVSTSPDSSVFQPNHEVRQSKVRFLYPDRPDSGWIFERLLEVTMDANNKFFGFNLWGFVEGIQFTEYNAPGGKYDYHVDKAFGHVIRKLSISVQLTDPSTYEGGNLELFCAPQPEIAKREQGSITFFPSYTLHRVTPVTKGKRNSLVAWVTGDQYM